MNILFTVCGRAGSKGIKNKNIRTFLNYPLPYYTFSVISQYIECNKTDNIDIALNTDSKELIDIANNNPFIDIYVIDRLDELAGLDKLKLIALTATGYNNVDVEYCKRKGIKVANVTGYSTDTVAQHTLSLALHLIEKNHLYDEYVKSEKYEKSNFVARN